MADTLLGFALPFPKYDLLVALSAVALFLPMVVVINWIGNKAVSAFSSKKKRA